MDLLAHRGNWGRKERRASKEIQARSVNRERTASLESWDYRESPGSEGFWVLQV